MKKSLLSLMVGLVFIPATSVLADSILYDGSDTGLLQTDPFGTADSLFPANAISGNTVTVNGGAAIGGRVYGGVSDSSADVTGNTVHIDTGFALAAHGGYSSDGNVSGNSITLTDGTITSDLSGGTSMTGDASGNAVHLNGGSAMIIYGGHSNDGNAEGNTVVANGNGTGNAQYVYGGYSDNGNATGNTVSADDMTAMNVTGGYSSLGVASGNTVSTNGDTINGRIIGGESFSNDASNNRVRFNDSNATSVYGGYSNGGNVRDNTVCVNGSSIIHSGLFAGHSNTGDVTGNTAILNGGSVASASGGYSDSGNASYNTVMMNDGSVMGTLHGGVSDSGRAMNNVVNVNGGTAMNVYGGSSESSDATGNTVTLNDGNVIAIFGGTSDTGNATGNTVNLSGGTVTGEVWGGRSTSGDYFTGNSLNVSSRYTLANLQNFQNLNFTLPADFQPGETLVESDTVSLSQNSSQFQTIGSINMAAGNNAIKAGDSVLLIKSTNSYMASQLTSNKAQGFRGMSLMYDWDVKVNNSDSPGVNTNITATLAGVSANPQSHALLAGRAAELALLKQGGDLLAGRAIENMVANAQAGHSGFFAMQGGHSHYDSGSSFDLDSFTMLAGSAWGTKINDKAVSLGAFVEAGTGNYSSDNSFTNLASVRGNGNSDYIGAGLISDINFNNGFSADATLRFGRIRSDFNSDFYADGQQASYEKTSSLYYGAHINGAYKWAISHQDALNTYARYSWTHINSDKVHVLGDEFSFDSANSHRIRIGTKYARTSGSFMPYAGIAYEYEFDGKEGGNVLGYSMKETDLGGSTFVGELGVSWLPTNNENLRLNVAVEGFAGKREGAMGSARVHYRF